MSYVGLSGGFGTLSMGRVGSAGGNSTGGMLDNSFHYGNSYTGFRTGNAISYSNSVGGVSVQLDAIMDPKKESDGAVDETQLGLSMNLGDFGKLAVSHVNVEDTMKDGMVDITVRDLMDDGENSSTISGRYTINADGVVTAESDLIWETEGHQVFDPKSAKKIVLKHTFGTTTKTVVKAMKVYHAEGHTFTSTVSDAANKVRMKDGKLQVASCTDACNKSTTVWVSEDYVLDGNTATTDSGIKEYTVHGGEADSTFAVDTTGTATITNVTPGEKKSTIAAEFGLGGITAFVGYSQVESKMKGAKKDKITHYGIRGGLGDSGVNFLVQLRSEDLQGSKPMDADRDPYVVNMSKSLGDGATAYIEHGTGDAKGEKANTRIGMIVNF